MRKRLSAVILTAVLAVNSVAAPAAGEVVVEQDFSQEAEASGEPVDEVGDALPDEDISGEVIEGDADPDSSDAEEYADYPDQAESLGEEDDVFLIEDEDLESVYEESWNEWETEAESDLLMEMEEEELPTEAEDILTEDLIEEAKTAGEDDFFAGVDVIYDGATMAPFAGRTLQDVADHYGQARLAATTYSDGDANTWYDEKPSRTAPYAPGKLTDNTHEAMTAMQNFYRWLAGANPLVAGSYHTESMQCQALDRNFEWGHYISQSSKPEDMDQELWDKGYSCNHNVLAYGYTPRGCISGWVNEGYSQYYKSWDTLGHRYFMIGQNIRGMRYGYVGNIGLGGSYSPGGSNAISSSQAFTAFPSPGYVPLDMISARDAAWSVELNSSCLRYTSAADLKIRVTDLATGESYLCTQENDGIMLSTGMIGFKQPAVSYYSGSYRVEIAGLVDTATSKPAGITYTVEFTDVRQKAPSRVTSLSCVTSRYYINTNMNNTESLKKLLPVVESDVRVTCENGMTVTVPVSKAWSVDEEGMCFTSEADLSQIPDNWIIPDGFSAQVKIDISTSTSYNVSRELRVYKDGKTVFDNAPVYEGDTLQFAAYANSSSGTYTKICRIEGNPETGYTAKVKYDSKTSEGWYTEGYYHYYTGTVSLQDAGEYVTLLTLNAGASAVYVTSKDFYHLNVKKSITQAVIDPISDMEYTGFEIIPKLVVRDGEKVLTEGTDYTLTASNNVECGDKTATVTVTGTGLYDESTQAAFSIVPKDISTLEAASPADLTYNAKAQTPDITMTYGELVLKKDTDYTLSYTDNTNAGTGKIQITGKGNYKGSRTAEFTIAPEDISKAVFSRETTVAYTGKELTPQLSATYAEAPIAQGTDFEITSCEDNVNVGTGKAAVNGKGNFTGSCEVPFTITPRSIANAAIQTVKDQEYTRFAITPAVTVLDGETELKEGTDYTVSYADNTAVGKDTAKVVLEGKGNYEGTLKGTFSINAKPVADLVVSPIKSVTYDGKEQTPEVTVTFGDYTLVQGTDYTLSYEDNTNAGNGKAIINGTGSYTGTRTETFTIEPEDISKAAFVQGAYFTYTGSPIIPSISGSYDGKALAEGTDYEISGCEDNTNVGTAKAAVKGKGNFTGETKVEFAIVPKSLSSASLQDVKPAEYTGSPITPSITVLDGEKELKEGTDYTVTFEDNTDAGEDTAKIILEGKGNYEGELNGTFSITPRSLNSAVVEEIPDQAFTAGGAQPQVVVTDGEKKLTEGTDYSVKFSENLTVGTASVSITGEGNYKDTVEKEFTIIQRIISQIDAEEVPDQEYVRDGACPGVTIKDGDIILTEDIDYTLEYADNDTVGEAKAVVTGKGNYTGKSTVLFNIIPRQISKASAKEIESCVFDYKEHTPDVALTDGDYVLVQDKDYTVSYSDNVNAGKDTAVASVTGIGNYGGTKEVAFTINPLSIETFVLDPVPEQTYNGSPVKPSVVISDGEYVLTQGTDYALTYTGNNAPGKGTVTVTGKGNYTGSKETSFEIKQGNPLGDEGDPSDPETMAGVENTVSKITNDKDMKGSTFSILQLKAAKVKNTSITLKWNKVPGATGYVIFGNKCGTKYRLKKITTVTGNKWTHSKLKKGTYYKYVVVAFKNIDGVQKQLAASKNIHVATTGGKVGNDKAVKVKQAKVTLKKGKTSKIKATAVAKSRKLRVSRHRKICYESSNPKVAKVTSAGKIKAVGKGTCYVYAYAQNGICKKIKVTVK